LISPECGYGSRSDVSSNESLARTDIELVDSGSAKSRHSIESIGSSAEQHSNEAGSSDEQPPNYVHCPSGSICSNKSAAGFASHMSSVDSSLFFDSLHSSTETFSHLASNEEENYLTGSSNSLYYSEC